MHFNRIYASYIICGYVLVLMLYRFGSHSELFKK